MTQKLATAEWADPDQFAEKNAYSTGRFWLGRSPVNGQPLGYDDDRHVCLVSGSRSGKGTTTIIPNLCLWPGSVVVVDPKGENATITAARRGPGSEHCEGLGQKVHVLDPFGVAKVDDGLRSRFNPLDAIDPTSPRAIDEAGSLADAIVVIPADSKDKHWEESARSVVKHLILHVLTSPLFKGRRNLITVRELITRGDHVGIEVMKKKGRTKHPTPHVLLWHGAKKNEAHGGVISGFGQTMQDMLKTAPRPYNSILSIASRQTEFLDSPDMRRCVEASDFQLADLKTDPKGVSIFLSLPPQFMGEHFRWLRMMVTLAVYEMQSVSEQPACGHRVLFCLDEFAGLEHMKVIETAVAQIAGFGVKLFFVLQSLEQLKATYKDAWQTFLSNAGMSIYYGIGDNFTREHVSEMIGDTELIREVATATETTNEQTTATAGTTSSKNWNTQETIGASEGSSTADNWKSMPLGLKTTAGFIAAITGNRSASKNKNVSTSTGTSTSDGGSQASQESTAKASGQSSATGRNETLQKRRLITPDEVARHFGRIDDKEDPIYPGRGLTVHINSTPSAVQRVNYFEDAFFEKKFDPHPDHGMPPPPKEHRVKALTPEFLLDLAWGDVLDMRTLRSEGDTIAVGDPYFEIVGLASMHKHYGDKPQVKDGSGYRRPPFIFRSPIAGQIKSISYDREQGAQMSVAGRGKPDTSIIREDITKVRQFLETNDASIKATEVKEMLWIKKLLTIFPLCWLIVPALTWGVYALLSAFEVNKIVVGIAVGLGVLICLFLAAVYGYFLFAWRETVRDFELANEKSERKLSTLNALYRDAGY